MGISSRDGQRPAVAADLIFESGEYLLGIARSGGEAAFRPVAGSISFGAPDNTGDGVPPGGEDSSTAYRLYLTEEARLPSGSGSTVIT